MMNYFHKLEVFWYKILYFLSFLMFIVFVVVGKSGKIYIFEFTLLSLNSFDLSVPLIIDSISLSFSMIMLFISGSVMFFSHYYMEGEKNMNRFSILILLFILSMNFLIFIPNLISLLIGWDGLGIISFLLVIFYQNNKSLSSGMITFLSNRVGDGLLIMSISLMTSMGSWNIFFSDSFGGGLVVILWCIVIGAMTKSAQIPFSAWLPAAMAAPTPVSALVHSSTLVTAGVYLIIRFHDQIFQIPNLSWYILNISTLTTLMAGMSAVCENDLKKIIALSTLSQLGVMMFSLALGLKMLCVFHLFTHALFKALLFMCAGSMIHSHLHFQDIRKLGMSWFYMPVSTICLNVANLSLCGFPFLSGFYSKDLILESMFENNISFTTLFLMILATFLTTFYSARLSYLSVMGMNSFIPMSSKLEESKSNIIPMLVMTMMSIVSGPSLFWMMYSECLEPWIDWSEKLLPLGLFFLAVGIIFFSDGLVFKNKTHSKLFFSCCNMWFLVGLSSQPMLSFFLKSGEDNIKLVDQGWNELLSGQGLYNVSKYFFWNFSMFQPNKVSMFGCFFLINLSLFFIYL